MRRQCHVRGRRFEDGFDGAEVWAVVVAGSV